MKKHGAEKKVMDNMATHTGFFAILVVFLALAIIFPCVCLAHFGIILPENDIIESSDSHSTSMVVAFMHPFEMEFIDLARPEKFGFVLLGQDNDVTGKLKPSGTDGHRSWRFSFTFKRPGDYLFYMIPAPYWEPAENRYIQHFTKVVINAFGMEKGWDRAAGLEAEIIPLTRPYGLWAGNIFTGRVIFRGKPVPNAEIEVEYLNRPGSENKKISAPSPPFATQVVKADSRGIFSYVMPIAGWWGFAALITDPGSMIHDGQRVDVEKGAVIWIHTRAITRE